MKSVIVLVLTIFVASAYALDATVLAKIKADEEECIKQVGANPETIKEMRERVFKNVDEKAKCVVYCILTKEEIFDESKNLIIDVAVETLRKKEEKPDVEKIRKALEHCKDSTGANDCDRAYNLYKCYLIYKST